jgi:hypothetical protein
MDEHRCKIVATWMEDSRCQCLLNGVIVEIEDQRYQSLNLSAVIEIEDYRCNRVAIQMEDPRCNSLRPRW